VAPLIESARAAREEAERVRLASLELRKAVRASSLLARATTEQAAATAAEASRKVQRAMLCGSPWSSLEWQREDEHLSHVLVPID
jgi:hypothetical protein